MLTHIDILPDELVVNQEYILNKIKKICAFDSGFLYFPDEIPAYCVKEGSYKPAFLKEERKIFVPLILKNNLLGILVLTNAYPLTSLDLLFEYVLLCVENIYFKKLSQIDPLTGFLNKGTILKILEKKIEEVNSLFLQNKPTYLPENEITSSFALCLIGFKNLKSIERLYGYEAKLDILKKICKSVAKNLITRLYVGSIDEGKFLIIAPNFTKKQCFDLYQKIKHCNKVKLEDYNTEIEFSIHMGMFIYPQDVNIYFAGKSELEKANLIIEILEKCLNLAEDIDKDICDISDLMTFGGKITNIINGKYEIDLGKREGVKEGDTFYVFSKRDLLSKDLHLVKGELIIVNVDVDKSLGEALFVRPDRPISKGDRIYLTHTLKGYEKSSYPKDKILDLKSFMFFFNQRKEKCFSVFIISTDSSKIKDIFKDYDKNFPFLKQTDLTIGEYGANNLILYLPNFSPDVSLDIGKKIYNKLKNMNINPIIGIGYYPCLNFVRKEIISNARHAFEHASLLKDAKIAIFDSTTLTLKGDKLFKQKNYLSAIEEYKLALILDEKNLIARNSLAICYILIGEYGKAKKEFETLLRYNPYDPMVLYNFGCLYIKLQDFNKAKECLIKCLKISKDYPFAILRLSKVWEAEGNFKKAKSLFKLAIRKDIKIAYRLLAELLLREGKAEEAQLYLHKAVSANPYDDKSFFLLAKLYSKNHQNLDIAKSLIKRAITLNPNNEVYKNFLTILTKKD